jgi:hypothetical protein
MLFLEHKLSDYSFEWHCKIGKTDFQTNKLWKAARAVINQEKVGSEHLNLMSFFGDHIKYFPTKCLEIIQNIFQQGGHWHNARDLVILLKLVVTFF